MGLQQTKSFLPISQSHTSLPICKCFHVLHLGNTLGAGYGMWVCVGELQSVGGTHRPVVGVQKWCIPSGNLGRLPDGICQVVSRIHVLLMSSESPDCSSPSPSPLLVVQHTSLFWMGQERSEPLWQCPTHPGNLGTLELSLFPMGEIRGQ